MRCYGSFLSVQALVVGLSTTVGGCALRSEGPPESRRLTAESADGRPRWIIRRREVQGRPIGEGVAVTMEVWYFRNMDYRSLAFEGTHVELVSNVFFFDWQKPNRLPSLGEFQTPMTPGLRRFEDNFRRHHKMLSRAKGDFGRIAPRIVPHAPIIHVNEHVSYFGMPLHSDIEDDFRAALEEVWNGDWTCVDCAEYRRDGRSILRIVRSANDGESRRSFSRGNLDCRSLDSRRLECIDPEFGIFEIPWIRNRR